jgi:hypothetical protein
MVSHHFGKPDPDSDQSEKTDPDSDPHEVKSRIRIGIEVQIPERWRLKMVPFRICIPVVADCQIRITFMRSRILIRIFIKVRKSDPHQSEKRDPDPHECDAERQHGPSLGTFTMPVVDNDMS